MRKLIGSSLRDDYTVIDDKQFIEETKDYKGDVGLDTEALGYDVYTGKLLSVQLSTPTDSYLIDCSCYNPIIAKDFIENNCIIAHNAKFDIRYLMHYGIIPRNVFDTFLVEKILQTDNKKSLKAVAEKYCGIELDKTVRGVIHKEGLSDRVINYAFEDVEYLHQIKEAQEKLLKEELLTETAWLENKAVTVFSYIEICGFTLDFLKWMDKVNTQKDIMNTKLKELTEYVINNFKGTKFVNQQLSLFENTDYTCNVDFNSQKEVVKLFKKIGINTKAKDKDTGLMKDSVDAKVLTPQKSKFPIIPIYLDYKKAQKDFTTYGDTFIKAINPITKRLHTVFDQLKNTGRVSSGHHNTNKNTDDEEDLFGNLELPNFQNIPNDLETRSCFISGKGNSLIICDYSGQEQIILANKSLDVNLLEFYDNGYGDMHSFNAQKMYPELANLSFKEIKEKHPDKRYNAKTTGFAINYGANEFTVGKELYDAYFKAFPGLKSYFEKIQRDALILGYLRFNNITNRRYKLYKFEEYKELKSKFTSEYWETYREEKNKNTNYFKTELYPEVRKCMSLEGNYKRQALNFPIQGTGADITKLALIYLFKEIIDRDMFMKVLIPNTIHDEIVLECPEDVAQEWALIVKDCMQRAGEVFCERVPLKAEPKISKCWIK